jgi:glutaredoxin
VREIHVAFTTVGDLANVTNAVQSGSLVLVTTEDCHFCEHAHEVLDSLRVSARVVSVDSMEAAELADRGIPLAFMPVLTDGERVIAYGRFSEKRLRKELGL